MRKTKPVCCLRKRKNIILTNGWKEEKLHCNRTRIEKSVISCKWPTFPSSPGQGGGRGGCIKMSVLKTFLQSAPLRCKEKCYQLSRFSTKAFKWEEGGRKSHTHASGVFQVFGNSKNVSSQKLFWLSPTTSSQTGHMFPSPTCLAVDLTRAPPWERLAHQSGVCWNWQSDKLGLYLLLPRILLTSFWCANSPS